MGVTAAGIRRETHTVQQGRDFTHRFLGVPGQPMHDQGFGHDVKDPHARVETGIGVLEDQLHVAAEGSQIRRFDLGDIAAFVKNPPPGNRHASKDCPTGGAFPGTGLSHKAQRFSREDVEGDIFHSMDDQLFLPPKPASPSMKMDGETLDTHQGSFMFEFLCRSSRLQWIIPRSILSFACGPWSVAKSFSFSPFPLFSPSPGTLGILDTLAHFRHFRIFSSLQAF